MMENVDIVYILVNLNVFFFKFFLHILINRIEIGWETTFVKFGKFFEFKNLEN